MHSFRRPIEISRDEAIADGRLIDISDVARDVGLVVPIAVTRTAWNHAFQMCIRGAGNDRNERVSYFVRKIKDKVLHIGVQSPLGFLYYHVQPIETFSGYQRIYVSFDRSDGGDVALTVSTSPSRIGTRRIQQILADQSRRDHFIEQGKLIELPVDSRVESLELPPIAATRLAWRRIVGETEANPNETLNERILIFLQAVRRARNFEEYGTSLRVLVQPSLSAQEPTSWQEVQCYYGVGPSDETVLTVIAEGDVLQGDRHSLGSI